MLRVLCRAQAGNDSGEIETITMMTMTTFRLDSKEVVCACRVAVESKLAYRWRNIYIYIYMYVNSRASKNFHYFNFYSGAIQHARLLSFLQDEKNAEHATLGETASFHITLEGSQLLKSFVYFFSVPRHSHPYTRRLKWYEAEHRHYPAVFGEKRGTNHISLSSLSELFRLVPSPPCIV